MGKASVIQINLDITFPRTFRWLFTFFCKMIIFYRYALETLSLSTTLIKPVFMLTMCPAVLLKQEPTSSDWSWKFTDKNISMFFMSLFILFTIFHSLLRSIFWDALALVFHLSGCILWTVVFMSLNHCLWYSENCVCGFAISYRHFFFKSRIFTETS